MAALTRLRARWRSDSGGEFIEFALAFPLLLLVVMGIVDFGLMFQQYEVITNAAREGARVGVLPSYDDADVQTRVQQYLDSGLLSAGSGPAAPPTITRQNVSVGGNCITTVKVTVAYPHNYLFLSGVMSFFDMYFGTGTLTAKTLNASSTMRSEVAAGTCP